MIEEKFTTIKQVENFLEGSRGLKFEYPDVDERYGWIQKVLIQFSYLSLNRKGKSIIRAYIGKTTGYQGAQISRLIRQYKATGYVKRTKYVRYKFPTKYKEEDIDLLAKTDQLHNLSGPAIRKILEREKLYGQQEYKNISCISVSHIYNLRKNKIYQKRHKWFSKTHSTKIPIGERKAPNPEGKPGYLRVDTVHQGDLNGRKGVYHINAVDQVTQWEIVVTIEQINETFLVPALTQLLAQFPFKLLGFHSDNGSEYINYKVANLLNKLLIKLTKSRARHTNDNALVETKNGAIIRKMLGYAHIPQPFARIINEFNIVYLNRYLNFHRPCYFAKAKILPKGKVKKVYPHKGVMTPYEKLKSIHNFKQYLIKNRSFEKLEAIASQFSDNQFAERMVTARNNLWNNISKRVA